MQLGMLRRIVGGVRLSLVGVLVVGVLVVAVLAGCGESGSFFEVEKEHDCEDSRYITITNIRTSDTSLEGWTITNEGFVYTFPKMTLAPGANIRVWRGVGTSDKGNLYLGQPDALWEVRNSSLIFERPPSATPAFGLVQMYFLGCHASPPMHTVQPSE